MDDDWLEEKLNNYGQKYKIKRYLYKARSPYQLLEVVETYDWGVMLLLDGAVQTTEKDEFIYHEMLTHPPLLLHPSPRKVLVIGGGDGGILRHCLKHPIEEACLVEIDQCVVDVCKKYLPSIVGNAFEDKRSKLFIEDGFAFLKRKEQRFDVIIVDSTDPVGEAEKLFSEEFYQLAYEALGEDGILITQSGSLFYQPNLIKNVSQRLSQLFPKVAILLIPVPTYPGVIWTATLASKLYDPFMIEPSEWQRRAKERGLEPRYWNPHLQFFPSDFPLLKRILEEGKPFAT
ncbi:MAG: polyamine aminopropyltransferase [bacterium]